MNRPGYFNSITRAKPRAGFTLVELLVVLAIITLISSFMLVAVGELRIMTQHSRTKQQVEKIHTLLMQKWDLRRLRSKAAYGEDRIRELGENHALRRLVDASLLTLP